MSFICPLPCSPPSSLQDNPLSVPKRQVTEAEAASMKLKYYSTEMHTASFVLPQFFKKVRSLSEQLALKYWTDMVAP